MKRIKYNSPVILTFTIICVSILLTDNMLGGNIMTLFTVYPRFDYTNIRSYFSLFSHALGHANWEHITGNFTFILLLGPILEEKYGSKNLMIMMFVTALITGILNVLFLSTALLGASGIVFMFIIMSSIVNVRSGEIPITFILVVALFLGKEVISATGEATGLAEATNVSNFGHILGGICGSAFAFLTLYLQGDTFKEENH